MKSDWNPLNDPIPENRFEQARALAIDLAWGCVHENWSSRVVQGDASLNRNPLSQKWPPGLIDLWLLKSFGYLELIPYSKVSNGPHTIRGQSVSIDSFILTPKAFALLETPKPSSVFISYSRKDSSAFALLLVERFRSIGQEPFLDIKDIGHTEPWHARLEYEVKKREHFVCVVGPTTLESEYVRQEIKWALEAEREFHIIYHHGAQDNKKNYPEIAEFFGKQAVVIEQENTSVYEARISQLFNQFGYMLQPMYIKSTTS